VYSLSITLAGLTILPFVLGPLAVLYFVVYIALCAKLWAWTCALDTAGVEWAELTREHTRAELFDTESMSLWKCISPSASRAESDAAALKAFRLLDADGSGLIDEAEAEALLKSVKVHHLVRHAVMRTLRQTGQAGGIDFPVFLRSIWNLGAKVDLAAPPLAELERCTLPEEKARAVYNAIDLDGSGELEQFELAELLVQWGCPDDEVFAYLKRHDEDGNGVIDCACGVRPSAARATPRAATHAFVPSPAVHEFFTKMQPIWGFGFSSVLLPKARARAKAKRWDAAPRASSFNTATADAAAAEATSPRVRASVSATVERITSMRRTPLEEVASV
jgi:Ca2+-binding EF-hand superfamily protein